jgi:hypothetical protein
MMKPISIALALGLAAAGATAFADDTTGSMSGTHMQQCIAKQKAKNDGRSDADISQACTAKMQKHQSQSSNGNSTGGMTPGNGPASSATTPTSPNYPSNSTPNETNQVPK